MQPCLKIMHIDFSIPCPENDVDFSIPCPENDVAY